MPVLSLQQAYNDAESAGFSGQSLATIVAIAEAESGLDTRAINCNNPGGTCDRGIVQINNLYHPEISDAQAYNPVTAFQAAYTISGGGSNFGPWTTYTNGAYKQYLSEVEALGGQQVPLSSPSQPYTPGLGIPGLSLPSFSADTLYKIGFVIAGLVLVFFAFKHFTGGTTLLEEEEK